MAEERIKYPIPHPGVDDGSELVSPDGPVGQALAALFQVCEEHQIAMFTCLGYRNSECVDEGDTAFQFSRVSIDNMMPGILEPLTLYTMLTHDQQVAVRTIIRTLMQESLNKQQQDQVQQMMDAVPANTKPA